MYRSLVRRRPLLAIVTAVLLSAELTGFAADAPDRSRIEEYEALSQDAADTLLQINLASTLDEKRRGLEHLGTLADRGSAHAAFQLAYANLLGLHGLTRNVARATALFDQAVREELPFQLLVYGVLLLSGENLPADARRGRALITRAAELGDVTAQVMLADNVADASLYMSAEDRLAWNVQLHMALTPDYLVSYGMPVLGRNVSRANMLLAYLYRTGTLVPKDEERLVGFEERIAPEYRKIAAGGLAYWLSGSNHFFQNLEEAKRYFEAALDDESPESINNYAWFLATTTDASFRDGARAVELARGLMDVDARNGRWVDTLAAAYAETQEFRLAVRTQRRAIKLLEGDEAVIEGAKTRLDVYLAGDPWRE